MKVLLTGGTGFVGKSIGQALTQRGDEVFVVTRTPQKYEGQMAYPCKLVSWKDLSSFISNQKIDSVIHLAGESVAGQRWNSEVKMKLINSRVDTTRDLIDAFQKANKKCSSFLSASAIGIYGDRGEEVLNETSSYGSDFLAEVCKSWEQEASKAQSVSDRIAIFRIGVVFGEMGGALEKMIPPYKDGYGAALASGKQWMSWIHKDDLVKMFLWALDNSKVNGTFNAVAPEPVRNMELSKFLCDFYKTPLLPNVPKFVLQMMFGEMSQVLLASQKVSSSEVINQGFKFQYSNFKSALENVLERLEKFETKVVFEQWVPKKVEDVFPFYENEKNLELLTPEWLNFKVLKKSTAELQKGTLLDYRIKFRGVPMGWTSRIEEFQKNKFFIDTQLKGPYKKWHHTHEFIPFANGTLVRDIVKYKMPMGALGYGASSWLVHSDVKNIFEFRSKKIADLFKINKNNTL